MLTETRRKLRHEVRRNTGSFVADKVDFENARVLISEQDQLLLDLKYSEGLSSKEIAEQLGKKRGTIDNQLTAAKKAAVLLFADMLGDFDQPVQYGFSQMVGGVSELSTSATRPQLVHPLLRRPKQPLQSVLVRPDVESCHSTSILADFGSRHRSHMKLRRSSNRRNTNTPWALLEALSLMALARRFVSDVE